MVRTLDYYRKKLYGPCSFFPFLLFKELIISLYNKEVLTCCIKYPPKLHFER